MKVGESTASASCTHPRMLVSRPRATYAPMRHLSFLVLLLALGCDTSATEDASTDAPRADAGPPILEPFAALGSTSEGLALGAFGGAPSIFVGTIDDRILRVTPDGAVHEFVAIEGPLGMVLRATGELVVCAKTDAGVPGIFEVAMDGTITALVLEDPEGANVDGVIASGTSLVLITSTTGGLRFDPAAPSVAPIELFGQRTLLLPANGVYGDEAFGPTELYVTSLARQDLFVVHTVP